MGIFWDLPARWDGPHCHLGKLIREEAYRHIDALNEFEVDPAKVVEGAKRDEFMRLEENKIWSMVNCGWSRVLEDWSAMVFYNPYAKEFEPWSVKLHKAIHELGESLGALKDAKPYTGEKQHACEAAEGAYTGKERLH